MFLAIFLTRAANGTLKQSMNFTINGNLRTLELPAAATLDKLVAALELKGDRIAVEHNGEIVQRTLAVSDNQAAEVLARHVGLAERQEGSFEASSAAVLGGLKGLGVPVSGDRLYDGSGLSRQDLLRTDTLSAVVRLAASHTHPDLREVLTGMIGEYARHLGHADLLRERIDGRLGQ